MIWNWRSRKTTRSGRGNAGGLKPLLKPDNPLYAIVPFYAWLLEPNQKPAAVLEAIAALPEEMKFGWDFSTTEPVLARLPPEAKKPPGSSSRFSKGKIGREELRQGLGEAIG